MKLHRWLNTILIVLGFIAVYLTQQQTELSLQECSDKLYLHLTGE